MFGVFVLVELLTFIVESIFIIAIWGQLRTVRCVFKDFAEYRKILLISTFVSYIDIDNNACLNYVRKRMKTCVGWWINNHTFDVHQECRRWRVVRWEKNSLPDMSWPLAMLRCIKTSLNISKIVVKFWPPHPDNVTSQARHPNFNNLGHGQVPQYQYRFLLYWELIVMSMNI